MSRGIALLFSRTFGFRKGCGSAPRPGRLYPRERPGTHCTGGWVGPRVGLDRCGKSRPHRDSITDRPARSSVAIPTELPDHNFYPSRNILLANTENGMGGERSTHEVAAEGDYQVGSGVDGRIILCDRQFTYYVTKRRVRATTVAGEKQ